MSHKQKTKKPQPTSSINLFDPIDLHGLHVRNRIWLPPMCLYAVEAQDGKPTPFHYQHYVSRAVGGFGMIIAEATAVSPQGRISPNDCGLWDDDQIQAWKWIVDDIKNAGAVAAIQLNHAGRKASSGDYRLGFERQTVPEEHGGWQPAGPTDQAFPEMREPHALSVEEIHGVVADFAAAAWRALAAGFQAIEIHAAHGYLLSQFLDPLINTRTDKYGGSLENRMRLTLEVVDAVREAVGDTVPIIVRISATDWADESAQGWDLAQSIELSRALQKHGADCIDVSTGGMLAGVHIPVKPLYQVPFATAIKEAVDIPVTAVGLITKPKQAQKLIARGLTDVVEVGRATYSNPYWPLKAAQKLGVTISRDEYAYPDAFPRVFKKSR